MTSPLHLLYDFESKLLLEQWGSKKNLPYGLQKCPPAKTVSFVNSKNIVTYGTRGNWLSPRISPPAAINNEFYLQ